MGLLITFSLGIFIMIGALIVRSVKNRGMIEQISVAVACGTMAALLLLDLLPEAMENLKVDNVIVVLLFAFLGIGILWALDYFMPEHEQVHGADNHRHEHKSTDVDVIHVGVVSSIAVMIHNLIEGMAVYSMATESLKVGILIAFGVGLHNIPMGMIIYITLKNEKRSKRMLLLFAVAVSTFIGGLMMRWLWFAITSFMIGALISMTAGMLVYIILFELVPYLVRAENRLLSVCGVLTGVAVIILSGFFE